MYTTVEFETGNGKHVSTKIHIDSDDMHIQVEKITISGTSYPTFGMRWKRMYLIIDIIEKYVNIPEHFYAEIDDRMLNYKLSFLD